MRNLRELDYCRDMSRAVMDHYGSTGDSTCGVFKLRPGHGLTLRIVASIDNNWEHVSVSTEGRCPTWEEMHMVKRMFFADEETVMQLHPPESVYLNVHPFCLHLWRPVGQEIPRPPAWMVG